MADVHLKAYKNGQDTLAREAGDAYIAHGVKVSSSQMLLDNSTNLVGNAAKALSGFGTAWSKNPLKFVEKDQSETVSGSWTFTGSAMDLSGVSALSLPTDSVKRTEIDWGTTGEKVRASDVPLDAAINGETDIYNSLLDIDNRVTVGISWKTVVYWSTASGVLVDGGVGVGGIKGNGRIFFAGQPSNDQTFTIATNKIMKAKTVGADPTVGEFDIGGTTAITATNFVAAANNATFASGRTAEVSGENTSTVNIRGNTIDTADFDFTNNLSNVAVTRDIRAGAAYADVVDGEAHRNEENNDAWGASIVAASITWDQIMAQPPGDITAVTAGAGLTGGGSSGGVTLNVGAGTGISVSADAIAFNQAASLANLTGTWTAGGAGVLDWSAAGDAALRIPVGAGAPGGGTSGAIYLDSTNNILYTYTAAWKAYARADLSNVDGVLSSTYGGTGANNSASVQYALAVFGASGNIGDLAAGLGTSSYVLTSNGAGSEPTWQSPGAPAAHDFGGASHSADTAADIGTKFSDVGANKVLTTSGGSVLGFESKGTAFNKAFGSGSGQVCEGDDARLSNNRTPSVHNLADLVYHNTAIISAFNSMISDGDFLADDGTVPLVANWSAGSYKITAKNFYSDGTATAAGLPAFKALASGTATALSSKDSDSFEWGCSGWSGAPVAVTIKAWVDAIDTGINWSLKFQHTEAGKTLLDINQDGDITFYGDGAWGDVEVYPGGGATNEMARDQWGGFQKSTTKAVTGNAYAGKLVAMVGNETVDGTTAAVDQSTVAKTPVVMVANTTVGAGAVVWSQVSGIAEIEVSQQPGAAPIVNDLVKGAFDGTIAKYSYAGTPPYYDFVIGRVYAMTNKAGVAHNPGVQDKILVLLAVGQAILTFVP